MSDKSNQSQFAAFISALKQRSASRILEFGTKDPSLLLEIISSAEWGSKIELHCSDEIGEGFDQQLMSAAEKTDTDFELIKHVGTELEMSDAVMEYAASYPFDAVFISTSSSNETLLTCLMVCHDILKADGVLGLSSNLTTDPSMSDAIVSFKIFLAMRTTKTPTTSL